MQNIYNIVVSYFIAHGCRTLQWHTADKWYELDSVSYLFNRDKCHA